MSSVDERFGCPEMDMEDIEEELEAKHAKELAELKIIQELEIKHARELSELRARQEAEKARKKRASQGTPNILWNRSRKRSRERSDASHGSEGKVLYGVLSGYPGEILAIP